MDAASASSYCPVALISLLNKLLKIILSDRLACFLSVNGIIGPQQAGFVNFRSCERQVFTILETLKARLRLKRSTYILFLDFRAAYDKVHRGALARVLRHIGIPENVVGLLEHLMSISHASVRVNGGLGKPFPTETGVPQGPESRRPPLVPSVRHLHRRPREIPQHSTRRPRCRCARGQCRFMPLCRRCRRSLLQQG